MDNRNLKDVVKFFDTTGTLDDATATSIARKLKFSEVLDLITAAEDNKPETAKEILSQYDNRFSQPAQEAAIQPITSVGSTTSTTGQSAFPKIAPKGNLPSTANAPAQGQDEQEGLDQLVNDPAKQNDPNVRQIKNLLQRMQK